MKCDCNMCNLDFSSDNGYEYVLEELKTTRKHIADDTAVKGCLQALSRDPQNSLVGMVAGWWMA